MGLKQVSTTTVTSAVSSVSITGIDDDSVYIVAFKDFQGANDTVVRLLRVTKGGSTQVAADYDSCFKGLYVDSSYGQSATPNTTYVSFGWNGTQTHEKAYGLIYLYNFNSASIKSYGTFEVTAINYAGNLRGFAGGFSHTVASASDGVTFGTHDGGNITSGTFTLYKVI